MKIPIIAFLFICSAFSSALATGSQLKKSQPHQGRGLVNIVAKPRLGHYIVVFKEYVDIDDAKQHLFKLEMDKTISHSIDSWFWDPPRLQMLPESDGTPIIWYSTPLSDDHVNNLRTDPMVEYVEEDQTFNLGVIEGDDSFESGGLDNKEGGDVTTRDSTWALARVTHRQWTQNERDNPSFVYQNDDGQGVTAYVIDTGVNIHHPEFEGRASYGKSFVRDNEDGHGEMRSADDENGHGSHVASLIAGKTYGVAPKASVVAVRVLDKNGSGTLSDVISGITWVVKEHLRKGRTTKSVMNLSLGSDKSPTVNRAVNSAVSSGVHVVVAAGNSFDDACDYSPAGASDVITVGATTFDDSLAFFSNFGKCVDIYSPGHKITGAWLGKELRTISGTSMASPMVAGVVSSFLSRGDYVDPKSLRSLLAQVATRDALDGLLDDSVNLLSYTCPVESSTDHCSKGAGDSSSLFDDLFFTLGFGTVQRTLQSLGGNLFRYNLA